MKTRQNRLPIGVLIVIASVAVASVAACSSTHVRPYATAYQDALTRYSGVGPIQQAWIDRFSAQFAAVGDETLDIRATIESVYAPSLYFSDTLLTTERRSDILSHFERMRGSEIVVEIDVLDQRIKGADLYLVWAMRATFKPGSAPVTSQTIGVSHLRFNADGEVVLQQDFWDSTAGFYSHLPILGRIIRAISARFTPEGVDE